MSDVVPRKSRVPHWGWLLAGTVLMIVVAAGIYFCLPVYRQQRTIADLRSRGIEVYTANEPDWFPNWIADDLRAVFSSAIFIDAGSFEFTDDDLRNLAELKNLNGLGLSKTQITDTGLVHLVRLKTLKLLRIEGTQVTPVGVSKIKAALPDLQVEGP